MKTVLIIIAIILVIVFFLSFNENSKYEDVKDVFS